MANQIYLDAEAKRLNNNVLYVYGLAVKLNNDKHLNCSSINVTKSSDVEFKNLENSLNWLQSHNLQDDFNLIFSHYDYNHENAERTKKLLEKFHLTNTHCLTTTLTKNNNLASLKNHLMNHLKSYIEKNHKSLKLLPKSSSNSDIINYKSSNKTLSRILKVDMSIRKQTQANHQLLSNMQGNNKLHSSKHQNIKNVKEAKTKNIKSNNSKAILSKLHSALCKLRIINRITQLPKYSRKLNIDDIHHWLGKNDDSTNMAKNIIDYLEQSGFITKAKNNNYKVLLTVHKSIL